MVELCNVMHRQLLTQVKGLIVSLGVSATIICCRITQQPKQLCWPWCLMFSLLPQRAWLGRGGIDNVKLNL